MGHATRQPIAIAPQPVRPLELLLAICRSQFHPDPLTVEFPDDFAWAALGDLAHWHGVFPLLYHSLKGNHWQQIPPDLQSRWTEQFHYHTQRNFQLLITLRHLLQAAASEPWQLLPVKGVTLALSLYGNVTQRRIRDLDLLVEVDQVARVQAWLEGLGYQCSDRLSLPQQQHRWHTHYETVLHHPETGVQLDLHWRVAPAYFACQLPVAAVLARSHPVIHQGITFPQLCPEDLLLLLCLNGAKDGWLELQHLCDLAAAVQAYPALDWAVLWERCRAYHGERVLLLGLGLVERLLGVTLPEKVRGQVQRDRIVNPLIAERCDRLADPHPTATTVLENRLFPLRLQTPPQQVRSLLTLLLPINERDLDWIELPPWLYGLYYPLRFLRLSRKYCQAIGIKMLRFKAASHVRPKQ
ncbi:nucleotidyltransferase domain-containing protein [Spirulina major]|uniref:nucleotidyltransferase domain-containing protein n=1 Tax=Spirulina major TaxID=270636 RepID=UPI000932D270|nr:nucleotidyltransferase family protein [Spirulina major]